MAQRTIHYLIGEELIRRCGFADAERFRAGNLLPDAHTHTSHREITHYPFSYMSGGEEMRGYDFERFRREFFPRVENDGLYLGYYMHLVEDACYRQMWKAHGLKGRIKSEEDIRLLHNDYHILNSHIASRCAAREIAYPENFESEPIGRIYPFRLRETLDALGRDFLERTEGETHFVTVDMLEEYLESSIPVCVDALERIISGAEPADPVALSW